MLGRSKLESGEYSCGDANIEGEQAYGFLCNRKVREQTTEGSNNIESGKKPKQESLKANPFRRVITKWGSHGAEIGETGGTC